jgi:hypothetical protein
MNMSIRKYASTSRVAALTLAFAVPGLAMAQEGYPPPPSQGDITAEAPGPGQWSHGHVDHHMWNRGAERIKALHDILGIKPDQEAAFQAFAAAMRPMPPRPGAMQRPDHAALAAMTTPERLDFMAKRMDAREGMMRAHFQRVADATKALYADLSPEQQRIMNALPELTHMGGGHDWGHHGGMEKMRDGPPGPPAGSGE